MDNARTNNTVAGRSGRRSGGAGFTLFEVLTALAILAFVSSSVLLVIDRCVVATGDSAMRMEAFELARENMEKILAGESVEEMADHGRSDKYPDLTWKTVVEAFDEPVMGKTWIRAVCSAEYTDSAGQTQTIKLERWITELSEQQADQLAGEPKTVEELTVEQLLDGVEKAAEYVGVDAETIAAWMADGLVTTNDGGFLKHNLDVYTRSDGKPTDLEKKQQVKSIEELAELLNKQQGDAEPASDELRGDEEDGRPTSAPRGRSNRMGMEDFMRTLTDREGR